MNVTKTTCVEKFFLHSYYRRKSPLVFKRVFEQIIILNVDLKILLNIENFYVFLRIFFFIFDL